VTHRGPFQPRTFCDSVRAAHGAVLGKIPVPAAQRPRGRHGEEAGWSWILFKTKFRRSPAEVSSNHGNLPARHLSTPRRKQTVRGDIKPLPLRQDLPGANHNPAALVSRGKFFIPTAIGTKFSHFKPQQPLSKSQTTPATCCPLPRLLG